MSNRDHIFNKLVHKKLSPSEAKSKILAQSDAITFSESVKWVYHSDVLSFLVEHLQHDIDYHVTDDYRVHKGKKLVKSGETVIANKNAIIQYVRDVHYKDGELVKGYVNPILVMQKVAPTTVLCVGHDGENVILAYSS